MSRTRTVIMGMDTPVMERKPVFPASQDAFQRYQDFAGRFKDFYASQQNISETEIVLHEKLSATSSSVTFKFGGNQLAASTDIGLSQDDAFIPIGVAILLGKVVDSKVGNTEFYQNLPSSVFSNSGETKALLSIYSGTFGFKESNVEIITGATSLRFLQKTPATATNLRMGDVVYHPMVKNMKLSGKSANEFEFKFKGDITGIQGAGGTAGDNYIQFRLYGFRIINGAESSMQNRFYLLQDFNFIFLVLGRFTEPTLKK